MVNGDDHEGCSERDPQTMTPPRVEAYDENYATEPAELKLWRSVLILGLREAALANETAESLEKARILYDDICASNADGAFSKAARSQRRSIKRIEKNLSRHQDATRWLMSNAFEVGSISWLCETLDLPSPPEIRRLLMSDKSRQSIINLEATRAER